MFLIVSRGTWPKNTRFDQYELILTLPWKHSMLVLVKQMVLLKKSELQNIRYWLKRYLNDKQNIDIDKDNDFTNIVFQPVSVDSKCQGIATDDLFPTYFRGGYI
jgi:hypothetical protein